MEFIAQYGASDSEEEQFSMSTQVFYKSKTKTVAPKGKALPTVQYKDSKIINPKPQKNEEKSKITYDSHEVDDLLETYDSNEVDDLSDSDENFNEYIAKQQIVSHEVDDPQNDYNEDRNNLQMISSVNVDLCNHINNDKLEWSLSPTPNDMDQDIIEPDDDLELKSVSDISIADSEYSEYVPSKDELKMITSDENSDEDSKLNRDKPQKYKKKRKESFDSHDVNSLLSPKQMKLPNSHITPKREKKCSTPKSHMSGSPKFGSPQSPMFESPKARQSRISLDIQMDDVNVYIGQVVEFLREKMKNCDLKKYLCGNSEPSLDHITTQVHQNNKNDVNRRLWNKSHICYYCGKCIIKMGRHFFKDHANEPEIQKIEDEDKNSPERKKAIQLMTLKGDFLHNCAVLKEQRGVLLVLRRPDANNPIPYTEFIPCIYCLGFVQKQQAYRHNKSCSYRINDFGDIEGNTIVSQGKFLLGKMTAHDDTSADWQKLQSTFRTDEVGLYILNDPILCSWGNSLVIKSGITQAKYIRDKLRCVATFCKSYLKAYGTDHISVQDIFQTKNFERIFKIAQSTYGTSLTPPVKLGGFIKEIMVIMKQQAILCVDTEKKEEIDNFLYLVNTKWNLISGPNIRTLKEQKPIVVEMPITSDIKKVLHFLTCDIEKYVIELSKNPTLDAWLNLCKNVLAYLIVFNRRREGEVSRLKLKTYTEKPNYDEMETDTLAQTLSSIEKYLCENYSYMTTVGKRNRRVPIVYPHYIEVALDSLVQHRQICGIKTENQFLFANTAMTNMRGGDVLRYIVEKCGLTCALQKPHLLKSTQLRKHVATIAQILVLNEEELGHISNHMGHSQTVHKAFYRQQESVIEKTHITKLLQLVNTGSIAKYKGKTLNDVNLQDVIIAATEDVDNELVDNAADDLDNDMNDEVGGDELDIDVDDPSPSTSNVSIDNEVESVPHSSQSYIKSKRTRNVWPKWVKDHIKNELGDCIDNISNLTRERANTFMEKYGLQERGFMKLKHVIYNMGRKPK